MRNTILVISFLAIIAALLVGFNLGRRFQRETNGAPTSPSPIPTRPLPKINSYQNTYCGISLDYPDSLTKLEATTGAMFVDPQNASNSVALACQEEIPRPTLVPERIETVDLVATSGASISAKLYHDASEKDGSPLDKLIFTNPKTGLDIFIAGFGSAFSQVISSLKLLP